MEVKLVVMGGKHAGQVIAVPGPQFLIGRGPECQLRPSHKEIGAVHCAVLVEQGRVAVRDMGSPAGTLVNGARIKAEQQLKNGDRLGIGPLEFEVHLTVSVGGKKRPAIRSIKEAAARTVASAARQEIDVAAWLAEPETPKQPALPRPVAAEDDDEGADQGPGDKGKMFGTEKQSKPASASSRDAAADVLRQMYGK